MAAAAGVAAEAGREGEEGLRENIMRPTPMSIGETLAKQGLTVAVAKLKRCERELAEAVELLNACVQAAAHDVVEDFSAVSNAADAAHAFLQRMENRS